jgi:hypothetical protein
MKRDRTNAADHRYANPWSFRRASSPSEAIADLRGRPIRPNCYRRGGLTINVASLDEIERVSDTDSEWRPTNSSLRALKRRQSATFSKYRRQAWCTELELATIDGLWNHGLSLRQLARRQRVSPAAISARISGLTKSGKAPEFTHWWRLRNRLLNQATR